MKLGLDTMGGDFAPAATIKGALLAKDSLASDATIVLIGDETRIKAELKNNNASENTFEIVHAPDVIEMHEHPTRALPQKPNSSIAVGFSLLKKGEIQSFASAGNTGAMLVGSIYSVGTSPGVIRPCITSILPKFEGGYNLLLDVGSNADCKPDVLFQFAILGSIYAESVYGIKNPKVGLLNIGEESEKGNLLTQAAHTLMKGTNDFNFVGNIEGRDIFRDKCDVIVCDGFTGNVVLKQAEGIYWLMKKRGIKDEYFDRFNYENYGGTAVLGVNSNVIIGHGISNDIAFKNMILHSKDVVSAQIIAKIKEQFFKWAK
jgi:glycerol-3-phosphate acyltransferase PlsX